MSDWIVEYSPKQKAIHLSSVMDAPDPSPDWKEIARLDCTHSEAIAWCDEWKKRHCRQPSGVPKGTFCHPDDRSIPIGKRKVEFTKWLMKQGEERDTARLICSRRFWREEHGRS